MAETTKRKVLFLDSRDRDFAVYPSCNDVRFTLTDTLRNIRKITLLSFVMWFPAHPVGNEMNNIFVVLDGIRGNSSVEFPVQMPPEPLSILAVLQGHNSLPGNLEDGITLYQASPEFAPWYVDFPQGINLLDIRIRLAYYDRSLVPALGPGSILPVTGFSWFAEQNEFSKQSNWHAVISIEDSLVI